MARGNLRSNTQEDCANKSYHSSSVLEGVVGLLIGATVPQWTVLRIIRRDCDSGAVYSGCSVRIRVLVVWVVGVATVVGRVYST